MSDAFHKLVSPCWGSSHILSCNSNIYNILEKNKWSLIFTLLIKPYKLKQKLSLSHEILEKGPKELDLQKWKAVICSKF